MPAVPPASQASDPPSHRSAFWDFFKVRHWRKGNVSKDSKIGVLTPTKIETYEDFNSRSPSLSDSSSHRNDPKLSVEYPESRVPPSSDGPRFAVEYPEFRVWQPETYPRKIAVRDCVRKYTWRGKFWSTISMPHAHEVVRVHMPLLLGESEYDNLALGWRGYGYLSKLNGGRKEKALITNPERWTIWSIPATYPPVFLSIFLILHQWVEDLESLKNMQMVEDSLKERVDGNFVDTIRKFVPESEEIAERLEQGESIDVDKALAMLKWHLCYLLKISSYFQIDFWLELVVKTGEWNRFESSFEFVFESAKDELLSQVCPDLKTGVSAHEMDECIGLLKERPAAIQFLADFCSGNRLFARRKLLGEDREKAWQSLILDASLNLSPVEETPTESEPCEAGGSIRLSEKRTKRGRGKLLHWATKPFRRCFEV